MAGVAVRLLSNVFLYAIHLIIEVSKFHQAFSLNLYSWASEASPIPHAHGDICPGKCVAPS